jgi:hypothetical protein
MNRAKLINQKLREVAKFLYYRGYGTPQLIFSDGSFVATTDWDPDALIEIASLLRRGERPLGFIAPLRKCFGAPFIRAWESADEEARAELASTAYRWYGHRIPASLGGFL